MDSPMGRSFLDLSSTDTLTEPPEDRSDGTTSEPRLPNSGINRSRKRYLPSIITSFPRKTVEDTGERLRSASVAVADVLGVDASELPQPFYGLIQDVNDSSAYSSSNGFQQPFNNARSMRKTSESSASVYSPYVDTATRRKSTDNTIEQRLIVAVANVLGMDSNSLPLEESFVDLGGNQRQARELRAKCMDVGLAIRTKDIMSCKTIAELQTRVTPLTPLWQTGDLIPPAIISPLELSSPEAPVALQRRRPPAIPPKALGRSSSARVQLKRGPSRRRNIQVEQALSLHSDVLRAAVLKPKAGPFEGQLVAFITLSGCVVEGPDDCEVKLQSAYYTSRLPAIRRSVESQVPPGLVPGVWIVLEKMPVDDTGKNNRRKLQTWIQNANDELQRQILSIDSEETLKQPTSAIERWLRKTASNVLHVDQTDIGMDMSFTTLGGNQSSATRFAAKSKAQGIPFSPEDVLHASSLTQLAALAASNEPLFENESEAAAEVFELSPMQRLYFHTPMGSDHKRLRVENGEYRFNQSMLFRLKRSVSLEDVRAAVEALVSQHPMLRCRFRPNGGSWYQYIEAEISSSYHFAHHSVRTNAEVEEVIGIAQSTIDIKNGPIFAAHHFHTHDGFQMIYLIAHHLVVDLKSWHIITADLEGLLTKGYLVSGYSASFKEWTLHRRQLIQTMESPNGASFGIPVGNSGYWGVDDASNTYGNAIAAGFTLGKEVTSVLESSCQALNTDPADIFMAALALSFAQTFRDRQIPPIWSQEHERSSLDMDRDVSETVGWFTTICPFSLDVSSTDDVLSILNRVKDSRRAISKDSVLYFGKNLTDVDSALSFASTHCPLELMFTYSGTLQNMQSQDVLLEQLPVPGKTLASSTSDIGCDVGRIALFEVSILVDQGEAKLKILYHKDSRRQEQIHNWICGYEGLLRQAITRLQHESPGFSLSDIPHMNVTDEGLGRLNREILPRLNLSISNIEAIYPVTPTQQSILTNHSLIPGSSKAQMIFDLETSGGPVDISRICAAWLQLSERHSALRTVFCQSVSKDGLYDQIVLRSHSPSMLFLEGDSVADAMASIDNLPPLPLTEGIPWHRLVVCQVAGKTFLKLEISQAACDVPSMTILFSELERAYSRGQIPSAPKVSCSEYTQHLKVTSHNVDFWREHLRGIRPCRFPTLISKRPTISEWETTSVDLKIPCENLKAFAYNYRIDVSTVLRVAWGLLLRTYVGTNNVCFGYRTSGRDIPIEGLRNAVGSFSTILASKLAILPHESITQLLLNAEDERGRVVHHKHVPVARIEHELKIKGEHLFNTCLSFGYEQVSDSFSEKPRCHHVRTEQASEYDINTDVHFHNGNVTVDVGYRILTSDQATNIAYAFGRAIETIMDAPTNLVKEVDLFSKHDHEQILAWNSMPEVAVSKEHVHQLIANQASLNPDIQAVCGWDGDLSYGDLHKFSMVLAKHLLAIGLKPQTPVPVIVDKSRWAVVAMLAVLHAGAIIVPIDAELTSIFSRIIKTVSPDFVLVSDDVQKHIGGLGRKVIVVNAESISAMSAQAVGMKPPHSASYEIACILFGPGSSDNSKGISYSHGALATACVGQGPTLLINPSSRVMQLSSYSTDTALFEVFTTLINGGCVCIPSAVERIQDFSGAVRRMRVNWTYLTPILSRKLDPESLPDLAVVCFHIRQLNSDAYAPWIGKAKVLLVYGAAEAGPFGLSATEVTDSKATQCFGNPFCGNFWIVSPEDNNRLMPVGALGELVIGGPTLASGFDINDPDVKTWVVKSSARAKSLLEKSGSRLLKTGHFVRYREEGEIEFVSAEGEEMEIDGWTFCLSDVEPKLRQCLGRGVNVVVETIAFNDPSSAPILAAFIELGENLFHGSEDLFRLSRITKERMYLSKKMADMVLRETLPSYMIPSTYIPVKRMPLTPTFQVDREELQRMIAGLSRKQLVGLAEVSNPQEVQATCFKPLPLTQVEQQMRDIWAQILCIKEDSITASDGFLSLGGDAILAHDLVIECRKRGIGISIVDVLRDTALAELCKGYATIEAPPETPQETRAVQPSSPNSWVDNEIAPRLGSDTSLIEDVAEASSLQTTFIESGMLQNHGNINYITINITGHIDWHKLENACFTLTTVHPILRTAFVSHGRQLYQTVIRSYRPEFSRFQCQSWRLGNLVAKVIKREQQEEVDFRRPITKFSYFDAGKSSALVMRLSRAQYDDRSLHVLVQDLGRFYQRNDQTIPRPSFCEVVRAAQSTYCNGSSEYWCGVLRGASMTQVVSQPSPSSVNLNSRTLHQQIPTGSLQNLGIPFESILKGAWSIVLSNLSGTHDVVFGQLVEGKHLNLPSGQVVSDVVGPMGNIIPVRIQLPDLPITPYEFFGRVQSQYVASLPYENMQTSEIIQRCTPWPSWTRFSTVVHHQNRGDDDKLTNFTIGGAACVLNCVESSHQDSDIFVKSAASGSCSVDISLAFCEKRVNLSFAEDVLKMLCSVISLLTSAFVMEPISLRGIGDSYSTSRIPLSAPRRDLSIPSPVDAVDPDRARAVHNIVSSAWDTILEAHTLKVPDIRSVPFYEIWGARIPAAELARYYTENMPASPDAERQTFTMEEIIEHPTMMQQYELIIAKQQDPQLRHSKSLMLMRAPPVWSRNKLKLPRVGNGGGFAPAHKKSSSYPKQAHHESVGSRGSTSMESMTMGSSQSEEDGDEDPREEVLPLGMGMATPEARRGTPPKGSEAKTRKKATLLGKMIPAISG
ncbi:hypothetical protein AAE478_006271 [Parahypoxylon ruwenzoriense]